VAKNPENKQIDIPILLGVLLTLGSLVLFSFSAVTIPYPFAWLGIFLQVLGGLFIYGSYRKKIKLLNIKSAINVQGISTEEEEAKRKQIEEQERRSKLNLQFEKITKIINDPQASNLKDNVIVSISNELNSVQSAYYEATTIGAKRVLKLAASFAYHVPDSQEVIFEFGEGLCGQVAKDGRLVNLKDVPDGYITVLSGLGKSTPGHLIIAPIKSGENILGVLELASFKAFDKDDEELIQLTCNELAKKLSH
jgi:putative methionine-R-sulfoxide reductase with GAF domain